VTPSRPAEAPRTPTTGSQAAAFVAADRWSLWRTLTRGLAHHLANAAQMLAIDPAPPRALSEAAERVTLAQARLSDVHRVDAPGPVLVPDVLEDVQALQRLQSGFPSVELAITTDGNLPPVGMTAADLRHVLLALVTNAKQAATGERAAIRLCARALEDGVEIAVEDGGPGLAPGLGERAFEPFVTTRDDGALGLGLAVARVLAERNGGALTMADGMPCFRLRLPAWRRTR
jgi:C4-dicarboxylate-specific signal transduction histidine kinase